MECFVVDGMFSKARVAILLMVVISIAFLIWLIALTVILQKMHDKPQTEASTSITTIPTTQSVNTTANPDENKVHWLPYKRTEGTCRDDYRIGYKNTTNLKQAIYF